MSEPSPTPEDQLPGLEDTAAPPAPDQPGGSPLPTATELDGLEADLERIDAVLAQLDEEP